MAQVKTDNSIVSIRGRFGGVYFKTDRHSIHIQAMPRVVHYTRTLAQTGNISSYSTMSVYWMLALLAFYSAAWAAYALVHYFTDKRGERKKITGYNWFIHYAMMFPETERPPFWQPPRQPGDLPDHIVTWQGRWTYEHAPGDWPADAPSGFYYPGLFHNGKPSWRTDDLMWFLWWKDTRWVLSEGLDFEGAGMTYYSPGAEIWDYYTNPVTGKWAHVYIGKPAE